MTVLVAMFVAASAAACSSGNDDAGTGAGGGPLTEAASPSPVSGQPSAPQPLEAAVVTPVNGVIEVEISGARFEQNNLEVSLGEPVTIRVTNLDGQAHNLRFAGLDGVYDTEDDAIAAPDPVPPDGGTAELIYAPAVPGQYTFRCDYHPGTMGGRVTVR